jgi:hypothetical protein
MTATPARAPGSVRRTSSLDSGRPDGAGGPLVIDARARDLITAVDGTTTAHHAAIRLTVDEASREIVSVQAEPKLPGLGKLAGRPSGAGFRRALAELLPDEGRQRSLTHLLLDDLPGASLVSGYALLRSGQIARSRSGGAEIARGMADLCAGWAADGSMLQVTRATGLVPTPYGPPAPTIEDPDDALSWHAMAPLGPHAMRRRRRLDVGPADAVGRHAVDVHFRDSHSGDGDGDGETVVHEYTATASVDAASLRLVALTPKAQVLPWQECPGALVSASRLVGTTLDDLATTVRRELVGVTSCTHLNDTFRSLADLTALLPLVPAVTG